MKLMIISGPPAVGKMTVGQEIAKQTGLKLFHNHMSIELVFQFFEFGTPAFRRLVKLIRSEIFREVAQSNLPGLIFTMVWAYDLQEDWDEVDELSQPFVEAGAEIYYVELAAALEERLTRNKDPHRLAHKASKRDTERSEKALLHSEKTYRMNSLEGEFKRPHYFKIDNTHLSASETAQKIIQAFKL